MITIHYSAWFGNWNIRYLKNSFFGIVYLLEIDYNDTGRLKFVEVIRLIELRTINEDNYQQCCSLKATVENESFVDSVTFSLAEAWVFYKDTKPFAIYNNDEMIGFVSMYVGERNYQIINFLIDDVFQRKGLGTEAAKICINYLQKEYNAERVSIPVDLGNMAAQNFWEKIGFVFSDSVEDGYVFMRLYLS